VEGGGHRERAGGGGLACTSQAGRSEYLGIDWLLGLLSPSHTLREGHPIVAVLLQLRVAVPVRMAGTIAADWKR
jgi:hypothetical protein